MGWGLGGQSCGHHCSITFPGQAVPSVSRWMGSPLGWVSQARLVGFPHIHGMRVRRARGRVDGVKLYNPVPPTPMETFPDASTARATWAAFIFLLSLLIGKANCLPWHTACCSPAFTP